MLPQAVPRRRRSRRKPLLRLVKKCAYPIGTLLLHRHGTEERVRGDASCMRCSSSSLLLENRSRKGTEAEAACRSPAISRFRIARHFGSSCQRFQAHRHTAGRYTVTPGRSGGALKTSRAWARACGALPSTRRRRAAPRSGTSQRQTVDSGWRDRHESRVSNKQA